MPTRLVSATCLCVLLLATVTGCPWQKTSATATKALATMTRAADSDADDLLRQNKTLIGLPKNDFTDEDWVIRTRALQEAEPFVLDAAADTVDASLVGAYRSAATEAASTASKSLTTTTAKQEFLTDLTEVTKDQAISVACGNILDVLAPDDRPAEPGAWSEVQDVVEEVIVKLVTRGWARASVEGAVDWGYYTTSVTEDAERFVAAADGYSTQTVVQLLGRPPVQRALMVYLRTCYSPPRMP